MTTNQNFANQFIHHSNEPLGLRQAQAADAQAGVREPEPEPEPQAHFSEPQAHFSEPQTQLPTRDSTNGNMSDNTRFSNGVDEKVNGNGKDISPVELSHVPTHTEATSERAFSNILKPPDSYTAEGVYWADLPFGQRSSFINRQCLSIWREELINIGRMTYRDPFSVVGAYFSTHVINGLGMFVEGYTLFSVGNIKSLFKSSYPACWKTNKVCNKKWMDAVDYLEIIGIIIGQITVGLEGDWVGRKFGMVQDAAVMTLGSVMLTAMWGTTLNGWVICYAWSLFVYGFGVGGEYPMTSTRAMENHGGRFSTSTGDRLHRGRNVAMAFLMQGWGQFFNQAVLILCLLIFHHGSMMQPVSTVATQWTFRVSFGLIAGVTLFLVYYRLYRIKYASEVLDETKQRLHTSGYDIRSLKLALHHYWHRLVGTTISWYANDFFFYGAKIFTSVFVAQITGSKDAPDSLQETWLYNLINIGVSMVGYYLAAFLIDHKAYGRKWMQANGLICMFALNTACAFGYHKLNQPGSKIHWFQFIYFMTGFFTQFGPNSTSFLLAAEVYPASIRATCHGVSAASGKLGALTPSIVYNYTTGPKENFQIVNFFALLAWFVTLIFIPDTTGLDLREQERYWEYVMEGRGDEYHGVAVHPRHLSWYERFVLKRHLAYNPELDYQQKRDELRSIYQSSITQYETNQKDLTLQQRDFFESELGNLALKERGLDAPIRRDVHESKLADVEKGL